MTLPVKEITEYLENIAPLDLQEEWDNSGLQIGSKEDLVKGVLLTLDVTDKAVDLAKEKDLNLIISHHPLIFGGLKSIDLSSYKGRLVADIIKSGMTVYSAHTNLDKAENGVNYALANKIGLKDLVNLADYDQDGIGIIGDFTGTLDELLDKLGPREEIKIYGKPRDKITKICIIGGSGSFGIKIAKDLSCDCLITGDIKHHDAQAAYEEDLMLIDLGHYNSEIPVLCSLKDQLQAVFKDLIIEIFEGNVFRS